MSAQALIIATPEDLAVRIDIQPARSTTVISGHSGPATRAEAVTGGPALPWSAGGMDRAGKEGRGRHVRSTFPGDSGIKSYWR